LHSGKLIQFASDLENIYDAHPSIHSCFTP
jgi:hypothetical protein